MGACQSFKTTRFGLKCNWTISGMSVIGQTNESQQAFLTKTYILRIEIIMVEENKICSHYKFVHIVHVQMHRHTLWGIHQNGVYALPFPIEWNIFHLGFHR